MYAISDNILDSKTVKPHSRYKKKYLKFCLFVLDPSAVTSTIYMFQ